MAMFFQFNPYFGQGRHHYRRMTKRLLRPVILGATVLGAALLAPAFLSGCTAQPAGIEQTEDIAPSDEGIIIYPAKAIITMNPVRSRAKAVAVNKAGKIIATGRAEDLQKRYDTAKINAVFADKVITPGLIDPHIHIILGAMMYGLDFVPPWDMETPKGTVSGLPNKAALLAKIAEFERAMPPKSDKSSPDKSSSDASKANIKTPLFLYGYHNLVQGDLTRQDLDAISQQRPIFIWHYSGHDFYLNSAAIKLAQLTPQLAEDFHGIGLDADGALSGRIYEDATLALFKTIGPYLLSPDHIKKGFEGYEQIFARSGVTSVAEMGYGLFGRALEDKYIAQFYTQDDNYRLYLVPEHRAFTQEFGDQAPAMIQSMQADPPRDPQILPQVKLFTDAAFYSQTMKLSPPGYIGGQSQGTDGLWVTQPQDLAGVMRPYWQAGLDIHIHSNGDAAQDATLEAFETLPKGDAGQRLIIEHGGLFRPEQIRRAGALGVGISAASHYVKYMGADYKAAIGARTDYITPLASALKAGMIATLHSDAPLAPPQPLKAASVHMTRETRQGGVSNPDERLSPEQALKAITLDAAWSLGLETQIGSIEAGKWADFTILEQDPIAVAAQDWPNIGVWGVVLRGDIRPVQE